LEIGDAVLGIEAKKPFHLSHDFRADAVTGEKEELESGHEQRLVPIRRRLLKARAGLGKPRGATPKC
jgi:hypothetical protein